MSEQDKLLIYQTFSGILLILKRQASISGDDASDMMDMMNKMAIREGETIRVKVDVKV